VILKNELAVRLAAVRDDTKYKQKPAFRDDHRVFGALRYEPKFFSKNGAHTSFRANAETGEIDGINPRATPPIDAITPWFSSMNKATYNWQNIGEVTDRNNARYSPYVGAAGGRIYDGNIVTFSDPGSSAQGIAFAASPYSYPTGQPTTSNDPSNGSYRGITTYNNIAQNLRMPGFAISPYKAKSITGRLDFRFLQQTHRGQESQQHQRVRHLQSQLNQTFLNNKLGFELAYDHQDTKWGWRNFLAWDAAAITVDIMRTLIDGSPNPNVGSRDGYRRRRLGRQRQHATRPRVRSRHGVRRTRFQRRARQREPPCPLLGPPCRDVERFSAIGGDDQSQLEQLVCRHRLRADRRPVCRPSFARRRHVDLSFRAAHECEFRLRSRSCANHRAPGGNEHHGQELEHAFK